MATARRFVFFEDMKSGGQRLMLADLDRSRFRFAPSARIIAQMATVPGDPPVSGVPETYLTIACRPDNALVAAHALQRGTDFIDHNVAVFDMETGAQLFRFNEHSVSDVNRANCPCAVFDAYLSALAASGEPQSYLDTLDYAVDVETTGNIGAPRLEWSATGSLIATFEFEVVVRPQAMIGQGRFAFEIAPAAAANGTVQILSRNAGIAPALSPRNLFSVRSLSTRLLPGGPPVIHYGKSPVSFAPWPWKWLPRWLGGIFPSAYRKALDVQGFVR